MKKYIIIIIFTVFCIFIFCIAKETKTTNANTTVLISNNKLKQNTITGKSIELSEKNMLQVVETKENFSDQIKQGIIGVLEIEKIKLKAGVKEGITNKTIDKNIGHFKNTNLWFGNIGLCAHNSGYTKNHFAKLKHLVIGDEVIYSTLYGTRKYIVNNILEISENDIHILEESMENKLTMITCITNKPNKRLCVQAIEKE